MLDRPIQKLIPNADDLLAMNAQQLAPVLLHLGLQQYQQAGFIPDAVSETTVSEGYPGHKRDNVENHLNRAWNWIERQGFIEPAPGMNGRNGWRMLTDEGRAIAEGANLDAIRVRQEFPRGILHEAVLAKCEGQFMSGHYADAIERSFKVVRDRLRDLTGHEKGSDAFGKGKLFINGAIAPHVEEDFNKGVQFLTMAIDMFRNEKAHTSETGVNEPTKALQYLTLSSLAMRLLDGAEVRG
jgi:uncharacterized protein (TIGR02391 family)